ncbi:MAG: beta-N-acetylhexosaminidase [Aggregatilineales bacterium]
MSHYTTLILLPQPRTLTSRGGTITLLDGKLIAIAASDLLFTAQRLQAALGAIGLHWEIVADSAALPADQIGARLLVTNMPGVGITSDKVSYQEYTLTIAANAENSAPITISGPSAQAVWYGVCTVRQIVSQTGQTLPALTIIDHPDFARRGVMLDISRDKVPTMNTVYSLVDRLADWKINELQLYTEHTFTYQRHPIVWANASPMTGQQILELDRYCRERFIDLVPNQNSFGHMHRWLMHDEYRDLAEYPAGFDWPMFLTPRPFSLAASDPRSIALIAELYEELLPHFSSRYFNIGCDETFDLGKGRSQTLVEQIGKGRAYLQYLSKVAALAQQHGRTPMFWGDIIMEHPELVPELPAGLIAMEWGYEANHPFDRDGERFAEAKIPFYVCPGTSSWVSLVGRTDNAIGNLRNAALNGRKYGAIGYLNTDWGDYGHWQPLSVSYLGFAYGAALSWATDANLNFDVPAVLSRFAFDDPSGIMGRAAYDAGNAYQIVKTTSHFNGAVMVRALFTSLDRLRSHEWLPNTKDKPLVFNTDQLHTALHTMDEQIAALADARPADALVIDEYKVAMRLWQHGCKRLLMAEGEPSFTNAAMAAELRELREQFRVTWLARARPGGLDDSLTRLDRLFADYETPSTP